MAPGPAHAQTAQTVTEDWALIPSGIGPHESFRLLFVTSTARNAEPSNIGDYNTYVQDRADDGHSAIDSFSDEFLALISTTATDARDNTATTGTGVPIYWVNGAKVADDYADFYDGNWDSTSPRDEDGSTFGFQADVWTGSTPDGTEFGTRAAGQNTVRFGRPYSSGNEISASSAGSQFFRRLYALSPVITVSSLRPGTVTGVVVDQVTHNSIRVQWTKPGESSTRPITHFAIDTRERNSTDTGWTDWTRRQTPTVSFTSFTLTGLPSETRQQVRVFARAHQPGETPPPSSATRTLSSSPPSPTRRRASRRRQR